jgi:hypothetical protein
MPVSKSNFIGGNCEFTASPGEIQDATDNRDGIAEDQSIHPQVNTPSTFITTGS